MCDKWFATRVLFVLALLSFGTEQQLSAYIDPGTGTVVWQLLMASAVGALFYMRKLNPLKWFRGSKKKQDQPASR
jgi:hypothetical protein